MGISPLPQLPFHSNGKQSNEKTPEFNGGSLLNVKKQRITRKKARHVSCRRPRTRSISMKRRACREGRPRRPLNPIEKKLITLKKLVPSKESTGLEGLFRETANYILSLQMRVKVMQIMVKVLTGSSHRINDIHEPETLT